GRGDGRPPGRARPALRRSLGTCASARAIRERRPGVGAVRTRHTPPGAGGHSRRRVDHRPAAAPRPAPLRPVPRGRGSRHEPGVCLTGARMDAVELLIRKVRPNAVVPVRGYSGDAGLDLTSCDRVELAPGERALVSTGLAVAIPE